jgi:hypothetical protein
MSGATLPDTLYYLRNFRQAIQWVVERNDDLLSSAEREFASTLKALPVPAQALLARLSMRRGVLFRGSRIRYAEIDPVADACAPLVDIGWLDARPTLSLDEVFRLCTRAELSERFGDWVSRMTKQDAYDALVDEHIGERAFEQWLDTDESVYHVAIAPMVRQFRLLHFGNFHQEWHEYTLAHLQIFKYESVPLDLASRPFESRADIEFFYALFECYEAASEGAELAETLALLPGTPGVQGWLRRQWDRLRYLLGQAAERENITDTALAMYRDNTQPDARVREVRLLERLGRSEEALTTARVLLAEGGSELVAQRVSRIVSRLERRRDGKSVNRSIQAAFTTTDLQLVHDPERRVEVLVQEHLSSADAPVYYVENSLIRSLFGLLCWDAIFHPVRGAFFHPFQSAPADLGCPDFVARRRGAFDSCLQRLETGEYSEVILRTFAEKHGTSAPFVHWLALEESTLRLALHCIPVEHLKLYFARMLDDLCENTSGFPDLVQFFVPARSYKFIEVKGPGDRVQDNQRRWLQFCARHGLPVEVCHVRWAEVSSAPACLSERALVA